MLMIVLVLDDDYSLIFIYIGYHYYSKHYAYHMILISNDWICVMIPTIIVITI